MINNLPFKIVDSFLFSEVFEKELLLLKFILEESYVSEWIILENAYSFQGEFKGLQAQKLLQEDERFLPFAHRIKIISQEMRPDVLNKKYVLDDEAFKVEFWQRDLAHDYFIENYSLQDWMIISDVDEAIDFTDASRSGELLARMKGQHDGVLHVATRRYWFDFDNEYKIMYGIPMCTKQHLVSTGKKLHDVRVDYHGELKMHWDNIIGFEYSSCFNIDHIMRKLETGSHMGYEKQHLVKSLYCNHRTISEKRKRKLTPDAKCFFETITLNEKNSPAYVRENLPLLKTNNIHANYKQNRQTEYPYLFSGKYIVQEFLKHAVKKVKRFARNVIHRVRVLKLNYE